MKYIKNFEKNINDDFIKSLKKGDYVIINSPELNVHNKLMIITAKPERSGDKYYVHSKDLNGVHYEEFYGSEIVKKLTTEEAELFININKYNL